MLYSPGFHEIRPLIQRTMDKHPHLKSRAEKAEALLLNFDLRYLDGWQVHSQSEENEWYAVNYAGCSCYDHMHGKRNQVDGRTFCKHKIALLAYDEILRNDLNKRIVGNLKFRQERITASHNPDRDLLLDTEQQPQIVTFKADHKFPRSICRVRVGQNGSYYFGNEACMHEYAAWLYDADPLPVTPEEEAAALAAAARTVGEYTEATEISHWQGMPQGTISSKMFRNTRELEHWLETGEIPVLIEIW